VIGGHTCVPRPGGLASAALFALHRAASPIDWAVSWIGFVSYDTLDPDVAEYLKNNKPPPGVRWHRQLTENIGVRALVSRCYEVIGMAKECRDMRELRDKVACHYGRQVVQFSLSLPNPETTPIEGFFPPTIKHPTK
jgi:hypothetical protein